MLRTGIGIGDLHVLLRVHSPFDIARFRYRFAAYEVDPRSSPSLSLWIDPCAQFIQPHDVPYPGVKAYITGEGIKLLRGGLSMWIAPDLSTEAFVRGPEKPFPLPFTEDAGAADTPLRIWFTHAMLQRKLGALIHACGYADERGGILFAGLSGAGKTTLARLLPSAGVLSDDQVALLVDGGTIRIASTPFVGVYGRTIPPKQAPLRMVVLLDRHWRGKVSPRLPSMQSLPALLACTPLYTRDAGDAASALTIIATALSRVPVLRSSPDLTTGIDAWLQQLEAHAFERTLQPQKRHCEG